MTQPRTPDTASDAAAEPRRTGIGPRLALQPDALGRQQTGEQTRFEVVQWDEA